MKRFQISLKILSPESGIGESQESTIKSSFFVYTFMVGFLPVICGETPEKHRRKAKRSKNGSRSL